MQLKRPKLTMHVGQVISPAKIPPGKPRKEYLQEYAAQVMEAVHNLVPQEEYTTEPEIVNERFELTITIRDQDQKEIQFPDHLTIQEDILLAKFFHRPAILKIFLFNLKLPVRSLQNLVEMPAVPDLIRACQSVLAYLAEENPYLLTYRFGVSEGLAMEASLKELLQLLQWCQSNDYRIQIQPTRYYYSIKEERDIRQTDQGSFQSWM